MKLIKSLLLAIVFFETNCKGRLTRRQLHKLKSLRKRVNSARTLALENQITKLQDLSVGRKLQEPDERFVTLIQETCANEVTAAIADPKDAAALEELITCVKDTFNNLFVDCFNDVPALQPAAQCFLELGFDNLFLEARNNADSDSDDDSEQDDNSDDDDSQDGDSDDDSDDEDDGDRRVLQDQPPTPINVEELLKFDDLLDIQDLSLKFDDIDDINVANLDAAQCDDIFGSETNPEVFSCLLLIEPGDIEDFDDFLEDEIDNSAACQDLALFAGEEEASEFLDDILFEETGEVFDDELGLSDQQVAENKLGKLNAAIQVCSEFDGGALQSLLQSFQSSGTSVRMSVISGVFAFLVGFMRN